MAKRPRKMIVKVAIAEDCHPELFGSLAAMPAAHRAERLRTLGYAGLVGAGLRLKGEEDLPVSLPVEVEEAPTAVRGALHKVEKAERMGSLASTMGAAVGF